ncbi:DUF3793 family protein [bacterium]|nr:DUF3793 family protein [bacterium]
MFSHRHIKKYHSHCCSGHADYLIGLLQKKLAVLLFKLKPACLLGLSHFENYDNISQCFLWTHYRCQVTKSLGLAYKEMGTKKNAQHILFYRPEHLQQVLEKENVCRFLSAQGYAACQTLEDYIDILAMRFKSRSVPHEIGLFLGFPLHDVEMFMEGKQRPLFPKGRWLVYKHPEKAIRTMELQKKAEMVMEKLIGNKKDPDLYMEKIAGYFIKQQMQIQTIGG